MMDSVELRKDEPMNRIKSVLVTILAAAAGVFAAVLFGFVGLIVVGIAATLAIVGAVVVGLSPKRNAKAQNATFRGKPIIEGEVVEQAPSQSRE